MRTIRWVILITIFVAMLFPSWLMIANSFSPAIGFLRKPPSLLPYAFTLDNYRRAFGLPLLSRWVFNTVILASAFIVGGVVVNGAAGYAFCYAKARWIRSAFWVFMAPIFVSRYVLIISQIRIIGILGLEGLTAVLAMSLFWATGIFLFRNYFRTIPGEIIESARMDGAGEWRVLLQIVFPMTGPMIGAAVVFLGMGALGDYIMQMLILQSAPTRTYLVGLMATAIDVYAVKNIGYDLAIGTLLFLPYLALFAASSRYFIKGLTGGVKA